MKIRTTAAAIGIALATLSGGVFAETDIFAGVKNVIGSSGLGGLGASLGNLTKAPNVAPGARAKTNLTYSVVFKKTTLSAPDGYKDIPNAPVGFHGYGRHEGSVYLSFFASGPKDFKGDASMEKSLKGKDATYAKGCAAKGGEFKIARERDGNNGYMCIRTDRTGSTAKSIVDTYAPLKIVKWFYEGKPSFTVIQVFGSSEGGENDAEILYMAAREEAGLISVVQPN